MALLLRSSVLLASLGLLATSVVLGGALPSNRATTEGVGTTNSDDKVPVEVSLSPNGTTYLAIGQKVRLACYIPSAAMRQDESDEDDGNNEGGEITNGGTGAGTPDPVPPPDVPTPAPVPPPDVPTPAPVTQPDVPPPVPVTQPDVPTPAPVTQPDGSTPAPVIPDANDIFVYIKCTNATNECNEVEVEEDFEFVCDKSWFNTRANWTEGEEPTIIEKQRFWKAITGTCNSQPMVVYCGSAFHIGSSMPAMLLLTAVGTLMAVFG